MIDVSSPSFTHLQAAIALLVERSGNTGRRVCELRNEIDAQKDAIIKALNRLVECGLLIKTNGDAVRYYAVFEEIPPVSVKIPMVSEEIPSPPVSSRKTPLKNQIHDSNKQTNKKREFVKEEESQEPQIPSPEPTPGKLASGILAGKAGSADVSPTYTPSAPAAPLPSETPSQARKASRRNHLLKIPPPSAEPTEPPVSPPKPS